MRFVLLNETAGIFKIDNLCKLETNLSSCYKNGECVTCFEIIFYIHNFDIFDS